MKYSTATKHLILLLQRKELTISALAKEFDVDSKQVKTILQKLEDAGIVEKCGRSKYRAKVKTYNMNLCDSPLLAESRKRMEEFILRCKMMNNTVCN